MYKKYILLLTKKKLYYFLILYSIAYVLFHIMTLDRSPMPWFDEVYFVNITESLISKGELLSSATCIDSDKPVLLYGPIYFLITGFSINNFGFGILQFRVPGLLFGVGVIISLFMIMKKSRIKFDHNIFICFVFSLDYIFSASMHSGRMETTALFFMLMSYLFITFNKKKQKSAIFLHNTFSAVFAALAVLTTPRIGYFVIPILIILIVRCFDKNEKFTYSHLMFWITIYIIILLSWILYAFGNISSLILYYSNYVDFIGGRGNIKIYQIPLIISFSMVIIIKAIEEPRIIFEEIIIFSGLSVFGYYIFVNDAGPYSSLMVPGAYVGIAFIISVLDIKRRTEKITYAIYSILIITNISIFVVKHIIILNQWESRNPEIAENFILKNIPIGSNVISDTKYYYALRKNKSHFKFLHRGLLKDIKLLDRINYHEKIYKFDYLVINEKRHKNILKKYLERIPLEKIDELEIENKNLFVSTILKISRKIESRKTGSFDSSIFKRIL